MWNPLPGPQQMALESKADFLFYGGAAGGGKTDLLLGAASQYHRRSIIFRREYPQLKAIVDRSQEIIGDRGILNKSDLYWRFPDGRQLEFGAVQLAGDEQKYQGRPHDLKGFDEIAHFLESQFRFLCGWNRSANARQRSRVIAAGNPPTEAEGEWVIRFWAPWLDPTHKNPAMPGELRWFTTVAGKDIEVPDNKPFVLVGEEMVYDFDPQKYDANKIITPLSRTFISARVEDNPYYMASGYMATLQAMPEPLRSKMLYGDFAAGREDHAYQVIPTAWVQAAQKRWEETPKPKDAPLSCIGVDVARGGNDNTILAPRYGAWFDKFAVYSGRETPDGESVAQLVIKMRLTHKCPVNVDVIGVGASVYDSLKRYIGFAVIPMNSSEGSEAKDITGNFGFVNCRSEWWWRMRESLDPEKGHNICLPPDRELLSDLVSPRFKMTPRGIQVELKDDIKKRIGRSPDKGDACVYANAIKYLPGQGFLDYYAGIADEIKEKEEALKKANPHNDVPPAPPTVQTLSDGSTVKF